MTEDQEKEQQQAWKDQTKKVNGFFGGFKKEYLYAMYAMFGPLIGYIVHSSFVDVTQDLLGVTVFLAWTGFWGIASFHAVMVEDKDE